MSRYEAPAMGGMLRRCVRAMVRRAGEGDVEALEELLRLEVELAAAIREAGAQLHDRGHSYAYLAAATGTSRQAAHKRFTRVEA